MPHEHSGQTPHCPLYTEQDHQHITRQLRNRWILVSIPCVLLAALLVFSLIIRLEWVTTVSTILVGAFLIAAYDLYIKPIVCYRRYLHNILHGLTREVSLPFVGISEDVNVVDGVNCRSLTCSDVDGKGRPYERLFYYDALKPIPDFQEGDMLRITHHGLIVADLEHA